MINSTVRNLVCGALALVGVGCGTTVVNIYGASASSGEEAMTTGSSSDSGTDVGTGGSDQGSSSASVGGSGGATGSSVSSSSATTGSGGEGGSQDPDCQEYSVDVSLGADMVPSGIITPNAMYGNASGLEILLDSQPNAYPLKVVRATVCQVDPDGDVADFTQVMLSYASTTFAAATQATGSCWTLLPTGNDFELPPGLGRLVWLGAEIATPVPDSQFPGVTHGIARSGHTPKLQLKDVTFAKLDGSCESTTDTDLQGSQMTLRGAQPLVGVQPLSSNVLSNTDMDLFKFQVAADGGMIGLKHVSISYAKAGTFSLSSFRVRRGGLELSLSDYAVRVYVHGATTLVDTLASNVQIGGCIYIEFQAEQTIIGGGNLYTLHATVNGAAAGHSLTLDLGISADAAYMSASVTGSVMDLGGFGLGLHDLDGLNHFTTFLWSDRTASPHNAISNDWSNDKFVEGLNGPTTTLSL